MGNNLNLYNDQGGTINDITNLKFYTGRGYEIPMQKTYVLQWEFIPGKLASKYLKAPLNGYFIGDIKFPKQGDSYNTLKILESNSEQEIDTDLQLAISDTINLLNE